MNIPHCFVLPDERPGVIPSPMKSHVTTLALSAMTALVTVVTGCTASSTGEVAGDSEDLAAKKESDPLANTVTVTEVDVPVSESTFTNEHTTVWLEWADLWQYTKLAH